MNFLTVLVFFLFSLTSAFCITPQEFKKLEQSANLRDAKDQYNLGVCYLKGQGVPKGSKKSAYWIKKYEESRKGR